MKLWVGVTDKEWFDFLRPRRPDEVNFWQPSGKALTGVLVEGTPFLFKLHSPHDFVVGGGFFVRFTTLPAVLAWSAFGEKNGVASYEALRKRIAQYRADQSRGDPEIGCNVLTAPFFLPEKAWIPVPRDWSKNIVRGKTYDTDEQIGKDLWQRVRAQLVEMQASPEENMIQAQRYGNEYLARARLGQGAFRVLVTDAYHRRCAITGEKTLPVLEAAHIKPFAVSGPNTIDNGLLLRSDLHTLFDLGYITITDDYRVEVSRQIRSRFENGREYYKYQGCPLAELPDGQQERPSRVFLDWHHDNVFVS